MHVINLPQIFNDNRHNWFYWVFLSIIIRLICVRLICIHNTGGPWSALHKLFMCHFSFHSIWFDLIWNINHSQCVAYVTLAWIFLLSFAFSGVCVCVFVVLVVGASCECICWFDNMQNSIPKAQLTLCINDRKLELKEWKRRAFIATTKTSVWACISDWLIVIGVWYFGAEGLICPWLLLSPTCIFCSFFSGLFRIWLLRIVAL